MHDFFKVIWKIINFLIAGLLLLMIILVFTNVVLRYGFDSGIRQSIELSLLGLTWVVMLGAVVVFRRNEHLAVHEFTEKLMPKWIFFLQKLMNVIILFTMVMLFVGSLNQSIDNWNNISPLTGIPSAMFSIAGVVAGGLISIIASIRIFSPKALSELTKMEKS